MTAYNRIIGGLVSIAAIWAALGIWQVNLEVLNCATNAAGWVVIMGGTMLGDYIALHAVFRNMEAKRKALETATNERYAKELAPILMNIDSHAVRWDIMARLPGDMFHATREDLGRLEDRKQAASK